MNFCIRGAAKRRGCLPPRFVEFLDQQVVPLLKAIAAFLHDDAKVDFIAPAHCTGEPAFGILKESFGDKYVYAGLGSTVIVGEKVTVKAEAGEPAKYAMDADDYRSYREAMAGGPYRALLCGRGRFAAASE